MKRQDYVLHVLGLQHLRSGDGTGSDGEERRLDTVGGQKIE